MFRSAVSAPFCVLSVVACIASYHIVISYLIVSIPCFCGIRVCPVRLPHDGMDERLGSAAANLVSGPC